MCALVLAVVVLVGGCSSGRHSAASSTTTTSTAPARVVHPTKDILLIRGLFQSLNRNFDSPAVGVAALAESDYYANYATSSPDRCSAYWATLGWTRFRQEFVPFELTIRAAPNWLNYDGVHPAGRVYAVTVRHTFSSYSPDVRDASRPLETRTTVIHVAVVHDVGLGDQAYLFWPCDPYTPSDTTSAEGKQPE